jgi:ubiquinone/menaquinone biosynthesis C-methylase UbiE/uncharacterized protein YbaR (Trm112 family)
MLAGPGIKPPQHSALTALLRCPECRTPITLDRDAAVCADGPHRFPVVEDIPVFVDEQQVAAHPQYRRQRAYFDSEFRRLARYEPENWRRSYLERLRSAGLLGAHGALVDVGVGGSGYTVIEAARAGQAAVGCDLSLEGLAKARRFAVAEGVAERTLWICCSAEKLPLATASFASSLAVAVIEHVPDDTAALAELARVLEPGGLAWVTVPHALRNVWPGFRGANRRHDRRLGHLRRYEAEALAERASSVGLEVVDAQFTGHPVKVAQLAAARLLPPRSGEPFWWWCERRDLARSRERRGSMQLSMVFRRA